jgi:hypothetical protein
MQDGLKWLEIFKAGRRTSSNGVTRDYSPQDLDQAVETYNPENFKAPLIVSYPAHHTGSYSDSDLHKSQLAFGYPEKLKRVGDKLLGGFKKISPKVGEWIRNGEILGFSSSFYLPNSLYNPYPGKLALRHVAGCGIDPPAVKGMDLPDNFTHPVADFENYSEDQEGAVEFGLDAQDDTIEDARIGVKFWNALRNVASFAGSSDFMMPGAHYESPVASLFKDFYQRTRDRLIEEEGVEEADKVYPIYILEQLANLASGSTPMLATWEDISQLREQIDQLKMSFERNSDSLSNSLNDYSEDEEFMPDEVEFEEMKESLSNLETKVRLLEQENRRLATENQTIAQQREVDRVTAFCEQQVRDRKLLPTQKDREVRFILSLDNTNTADYGEEGTITPREAYMNKLSGGRELWSNKQMPIGPEDAPLSFAQKAPDGFDARSTAQHRQVQAYAKEHNLSYAEAVDALLDTGALQ